MKVSELLVRLARERCLLGGVEPDAGKLHVRFRRGACPIRGMSTRPNRKIKEELNDTNNGLCNTFYFCNLNGSIFRDK